MNRSNRGIRVYFFSGFFIGAVLVFVSLVVVLPIFMSERLYYSLKDGKEVSGFGKTWLRVNPGTWTDRIQGRKFEAEALANAFRLIHEDSHPSAEEVFLIRINHVEGMDVKNLQFLFPDKGGLPDLDLKFHALLFALDVESEEHVEIREEAFNEIRRCIDVIELLFRNVAAPVYEEGTTE